MSSGKTKEVASPNSAALRENQPSLCEKRETRLYLELLSVEVASLFCAPLPHA